MNKKQAMLVEIGIEITNARWQIVTGIAKLEEDKKRETYLERLGEQLNSIVKKANSGSDLRVTNLKRIVQGSMMIVMVVVYKLQEQGEPTCIFSVDLTMHEGNKSLFVEIDGKRF